MGKRALHDANITYIDSVETAGPYINVRLKQGEVYRNILTQIFSLKSEYGSSDAGGNKVVVIDYSSPNIAKPMGVGHLRSTVIGQALANMYHATGFSVVRDNHLGDWGTQFGKLLYAYMHWGNDAEMERSPIEYLKELYVRFGKEAEKDPTIVDEARALFSRLEQKDTELMALWKRFSDLSLRDFEKVYGRLGITFDTAIGEAYFVDDADAVIDGCLEKGICTKGDEGGAVAVEAFDAVPSFLLRKQDGSSLYITRDIATIRFRKEEFDPAVILYVVGNEQELNFKQLFLLADAMEVSGDADMRHIGFGMVLVDGKKMSTRKGTTVELQALLDESVRRAKKTILEKNEGVAFEDAELDAIAEQIGIGTIVYNDLRQSRKKNISFDWAKMLDPRGGSSVYLQYTIARTRSIVSKVESEAIDPSKAVFVDPIEYRIAHALTRFPEVIVRAREEDAPHIIATYLEEIAQLFNTFYAEISIAKTDDADLKASRILLVRSVKTVLENGLRLLNIPVPERM
jgi:arginyl-tRNA synthetase